MRLIQCGGVKQAAISDGGLFADTGVNGRGENEKTNDRVKMTAR